MDMRLQVIVVPVSDVDRAKTFYTDAAGFRLDVDHRDGDFRVVQLTPPGSACSVTLMPNPESAGSLQGLHLVVTDIAAAAEFLSSRGVEISGVFHFAAGGQIEGPDPEGRDYNSFFTFSDPDGTGWMVQEVRGGAGQNT